MTLAQPLLIIVSSALVNNFVLAKFLGLCPIMGVSNNVKPACSMALATTFVLTTTSMVCYLVDHYLLMPLALSYLRIISFILTIAGVVAFTQQLMKTSYPLLHQVLGIYLPLITTNCAVLGLSLLNVNQQHSLSEAIFYGFGAAIGFSLVLILFARLREQLVAEQIPQPFQGTPIAFITCALMSLAFMGFAGLTKV